MPPVTADQVKQAVLAAGLEKAPAFPCQNCKQQISYLFSASAVTFDQKCTCNSGRLLAVKLETSYQQIADMLNSHAPSVRAMVWAHMGLAPLPNA